MLGGGLGDSSTNTDGADGGTPGKPGGNVTQDAAPPVPENCNMEEGPRYSAPCLDENTGVFVRVNAVGGSGTKASPYGTFAEALANMGDKRFIFATRGGYREDVRIERNVSIYGGFNEDWTHEDGKSEIIGTSAAHYALEVWGGTEALRFEDLKITGTQSARDLGVSSVAVYLHELATEAAPARFRRVEILAASGQDGHGGGDGSPQRAQYEGPFDGWECNGVKVNGGGGGTGILGVWGGGAGDGPARGSGGSSDGSCAAGSGTPGGPTQAPGPAGEGSPGSGWDLTAEGLVPRRGGNGAMGSHGSGGGGGGGTKSGSSTYVGGGGGRGGCGGTGGQAGTAGGVSVAMMVSQAFVTVEECVFTSAAGGNGGRGGGGGAGEEGGGGSGGSGPAGCQSGAGAKGGWGQTGGPGGPGLGGHSVVLLQIGPSVKVLNSTFTPGPGGNTANTSTKSGLELGVANLNAEGQMSPP